MTSNRIACVVLALTLAGLAWAGGQEDLSDDGHKELEAASKRLSELYNSVVGIILKPDIESADLESALAIACEASKIMENPVFVHVAPAAKDVVDAVASAGQAGAIAIFHGEEVSVLDQAGVSGEAIAHAAVQWEQRSQQLLRAGTDYHTVIYERLPDRIAMFRVISCSAAAGYEPVKDSFFQRLRRKIVEGVALVVGGGAIIAADIVFAGPTSALSLVSVGIGSGIVSGGVVSMVIPPPPESDG